MREWGIYAPVPKSHQLISAPNNVLQVWTDSWKQAAAYQEVLRDARGALAATDTVVYSRSWVRTAKPPV